MVGTLILSSLVEDLVTENPKFGFQSWPEGPAAGARCVGLPPWGRTPQSPFEPSSTASLGFYRFHGRRKLFVQIIVQGPL